MVTVCFSSMCVELDFSECKAKTFQWLRGDGIFSGEFYGCLAWKIEGFIVLVSGRLMNKEPAFEGLEMFRIETSNFSRRKDHGSPSCHFR